MKKLLSAVLVVSLALNVFLWRYSSSQSQQLEAHRARTVEVNALGQEGHELQKEPATEDEARVNEVRELARLRNEVVQLRKDSAEAAMLRPLAAEAAQLRTRLAVATQNLARAETALADAISVPPDELQRLKEEANSAQCINNLKQIGLAARMWANDNNDIFPPDFISMTNELNTPKILFCASDPAAVRVSEWSQLNQSRISYRLVNANGNDRDPNKVLTICTIHGHVGMSDGSAQRKN